MKKIIPTTLLALLTLTSFTYSTPQYRVKKRIGTGKIHSPISYLASYGDRIYVLEKSGNLLVFSAQSGSCKKKIDLDLPNTTTLAINKKGEVFVFSTKTKEVERVYKKRKYMATVYLGVTCKVFNVKGKELREIKLDYLKSASAARFIDGQLLVADQAQSALFTVDPMSGEKIKEKRRALRGCCGLFDFCEGPNNTYTIANLGAFKVQQYSLDGKVIKSFGKRGKDLNSFHGCCNPVSLAYLPDGSLVTVEKHDTRVKIYDADGKNARTIDNLENLVKGCSYIPITVDSEGNIFLAASAKKYIVKCVPAGKKTKSKHQL